MPSTVELTACRAVSYSVYLFIVFVRFMCRCRVLILIRHAAVRRSFTDRNVMRYHQQIQLRRLTTTMKAATMTIFTMCRFLLFIKRHSVAGV